MREKRTQVLITDDFLDGLVPSDRDQFFTDARQENFRVRLTPAGTIIFEARARYRGELRKERVGYYPDTKSAAARKLARTTIEDIRHGRDPKLEASVRAKAAEAASTTVEQLGERWMTEVVTPKRKPRTAEDYRRLLDQKITPVFGHKPVTSVQWEDVNNWHKDMAKTPRRANYAVATLKALFNFAERLKLRPPHTNPCKGVEFYRERNRERYLTEAEIGKAAGGIAKAEAEGKIGPHAAAALRLALFTGARSGELKAAKWSHFDRAQKIIRLPDSKTNDPRTIHLSEAALAVLTSLPRVGDYIIAGQNKDGGFSNLTRAWGIARKYAGLENCRLHDLRHSYASLAARKGVSLLMIGELLGHKTQATSKRYAHISADAAQTVNEGLGKAMEAAIEKPAPAANVVKLQKRRRPRG